MSVAVLPEFLRYVRRSVKPGEGRSRVRVPLGNDLPQDGGITGQLPRRTMEERTGEDNPVLASQVAARSADDEKNPPLYQVPDDTEVPPQPAGRVVPLPNPEPTVSRDDANRMLRESGLRPEREIFNSGNPSADLEEQREALQDYRPQKRGWWANVKASILPALLAGLRTGDPLGAVGGALGGAAVATADRKSADRIWKNRELAQVNSEIQNNTARQKDALSLEEQRARVRATNAQAGYYEHRPDLERDKSDALALDRKQKAVQREIGQRLRDPRPFDESDDYDADLAARAAELGVSMNRSGFGDAQKPFTIEVLDPTDPQHIRKMRMQFDRGTRQWSPVQAGGETVVTNRVQPVGDDGQTPAQRGADADRDRAFEATQEYRKATLGLSTARLEEQMRNGLSGRAGREFTTATRGLFERRRQIESQITDYRKRAAAYTIDPADAQKRVQALEAERDGITSQIDAERGKALGAMSSASPAASPRAGGSGRFAGRRMPRANLPAAARELGVSEAEAERIIKEQGGTVY